MRAALGGVTVPSDGISKLGFRRSMDLSDEVLDQVARAIVQRREEEERARLSAAVEHAADGIVLTDATRAVEYVNVAFQRLSGWSIGDARGKDLLALGATKADIAARQQVWMAVSRDGTDLSIAIELEVEEEILKEALEAARAKKQTLLSISPNLRGGR